MHTVVCESAVAALDFGVISLLNQNTCCASANVHVQEVMPEGYGPFTT